MRILIFGATSAIAEASAVAMAKELAKQKHQGQFFLVGRNREKLLKTSQSIAEAGGAILGSEVLNLRQLHEIKNTLGYAYSVMGSIDLALIAHGTLVPQNLCEESIDAFTQSAEENFLSQAVLLNCLFEALSQKATVAIITSVAGEAARPRSASYSAAKAALSRYIQGLRGKFWNQKRIKLVDIRPGWVETPMTKNAKGKFLTVSPAAVGGPIAHALLSSRPAVLYTPWFWRFIMMPLKALPMGFFKLLKP